MTDFGFDGDNTPVVTGSALEALNLKDTEYGVKSIHALMDVVDEYIPEPQRDVKSPFLLPIDNAFLVPGRGTVVVGTLSKGILKKNCEAELMGFDIKIKTTVTDIQVFKKSVPQVCVFCIYIFNFFLMFIKNIIVLKVNV